MVLVLAPGCRDETTANQNEGSTGTTHSSSGDTIAESTGSLDTTGGLDTTGELDDTTGDAEEESSSSGDGTECEPMPQGSPDPAWILVAETDAVRRIDSRGDLPLEAIEIEHPPDGQAFVRGFDHDSAVVLRSAGVGDDSLWLGTLEEPESFSLHKLDLAPAPDAESLWVAFSPDGSQVLFDAAATVGGSRALYLASMDGSSPSLLVEPNAASGTVELDFEFTPDGESVVFVADLDGTGELRRHQIPSMGPPGATPRDLGPRLPNESYRGYAADGSYMVLLGDAGLHRIDLTGVGPTEPELIFGPPSEGDYFNVGHFAPSRDWVVVTVNDGREVTPHAIDLRQAEPTPVALPIAINSDRVSPDESFYAYPSENYETVIADMREWPPLLVDVSLPSLPGTHTRHPSVFTDDDTLYVSDRSFLEPARALHRMTIDEGGRSSSELVHEWEDSQWQQPYAMVDERILLFSNISEVLAMDIECPTAPVSFADAVTAGSLIGVTHEPPLAKLIAHSIVLDREKELSSVRMYEFDARRDALGTLHELVELDSVPVWLALLPATAPDR